MEIKYMSYSILKDDEPENTVKRIKKILDALNIELQEQFYINNDKSAPVSVRVVLKDNFCIGTNGKGTCKENAMASAYAEFMERLQNLMLFSFEEYMDIIPDRINDEKNIKFDNDNLNKYFKNKISVYKNVKSANKNFDNFFCCPFFSVKKQKVYNLPFNIISRVNGSNGMAAGNTLQEAIVQGLSEICERYAMHEIILNKHPMAEIPENKYLKYDNIKRIINYYNKKGFNIYIKDASLNGKLPVICTVFEDTTNNIYSISFGSHPSLPIAIERTLTEFLQGIILSDNNQLQNLQYECYSSTKLRYTSLKNIYHSSVHRRTFYEKTAKLDKIFFNKDTTSSFYKAAFIKEDELADNKILLDFLTNKVLNISDDIYIRDVSFLGFPSVYIFVPNMSDVYGYTKKFLSTKLLESLWLRYSINSDKKYYNIENLLKHSEIYSFLNDLNSRIIFNVPSEYIALLCSIVLKKTNKIIKYTNIIFSQHRFVPYFTSEQLLTLKIIRDYYIALKHNKDKNLIIFNLRKKYDINDINYAVDVINELTFEMVLDIVIKKEKLKVFSNKKFIKKLSTAYKNNVPNQDDLKELYKKL